MASNTFILFQSWVIDSFYADSKVAQLLQLGVYNPEKLKEGAIDVQAKKEDR